jgi:hypothetical protein
VRSSRVIVLPRGPADGERGRVPHFRDEPSSLLSNFGKQGQPLLRIPTRHNGQSMSRCYGAEHSELLHKLLVCCDPISATEVPVWVISGGSGLPARRQVHLNKRTLVPRTERATLMRKQRRASIIALRSGRPSCSQTPQLRLPPLRAGRSQGRPGEMAPASNARVAGTLFLMSARVKVPRAMAPNTQARAAAWNARRHDGQQNLCARPPLCRGRNGRPHQGTLPRVPSSSRAAPLTPALRPRYR